jgi:hypothetical protein
MLFRTRGTVSSVSHAKNVKPAANCDWTLSGLNCYLLNLLGGFLKKVKLT